MATLPLDKTKIGRPSLDYLQKHPHDEVSCTADKPRVAHTKVVVKSILTLTLVTLLTWLAWTQYLHVLYRAAALALQPAPTQLAHLDHALLPTARTRRRLVLVGDVHGCITSLDALLSAVAFDRAHDHLILTGDLVAKGSASQAVVARAMALGASCVRGNWEDKLLRAHADAAPWDSSTPMPRLERAALAYLAACPVILSLGRVDAVPTADEVLVVHGGLMPGVELEAQDAELVMNLRSIDERKMVGYATRDAGAPWWRVWGRAQGRLATLERIGGEASRAKRGKFVVYGHDARTGLNVQDWSVGLDSACVTGGELSGLVIDGKGTREIFSVACKGHT